MGGAQFARNRHELGHAHSTASSDATSAQRLLESVGAARADDVLERGEIEATAVGIGCTVALH